MTIKTQPPVAATTHTSGGKARRVGAAKRADPATAMENVPRTFPRYRAVLRNAPLTQRVEIERNGVPCQVVQGLIEAVGISNSDFQRYVRIPKATFVKKMKDKAPFAGTAGQSVLGLMELINKVETMLAAEHDHAEARDFDVEKWVGRWIQRPQPALGGLTPAELMDTPSGRDSVMKVLGAIQSGAYQ